MGDGKRAMGKGQCKKNDRKGDGKTVTGKERWGKGDGKRVAGKGRWEKGDGERAMGKGRWETCDGKRVATNSISVETIDLLAAGN